jgi:Uri superfamily endonuclease
MQRRDDCGTILMEKKTGTYALILESREQKEIQIGKLGMLALSRGFYLYLGSALGPGGITARITHHQRVSQRPHWHIDYLRRALPLTEYWYTHDSRLMEHQWAGLAGMLRGASIPLARFGASDCCCESHLFHFKRKPGHRMFVKQLALMLPDHAPVLRVTE